MATTAKVALPPKKEAPRRSGRTERGTGIQISSNGNSDTTGALRLQRLRLLGIIGQRARLLADLAWESNHG